MCRFTYLFGSWTTKFLCKVSRGEEEIACNAGVGNGLVTNNNYAYFLLRLMAHMPNCYIVQSFAHFSLQHRVSGLWC